MPNVNNDDSLASSNKSFDEANYGIHSSDTADTDLMTMLMREADSMHRGGIHNV